MNRSLRGLTCLFSSSILLAPLVYPLNSVQAQTAGGNFGCPPGTRENPISLVRNGTFANNAQTGLGNQTPPAPVPPILDFTSNLPYRGDAVYPSDVVGGGNVFSGGGLSIQDERFNGGQIPNAPAGIVNGRGVTAAEATQVGVDPIAIPTYLYSNPNVDTAGNPVTTPGSPPPVIWSQTVTVTPSTVYNFKALFFNLLLPGASGVDPQIRLQVGPSNIQTSTPIDVGDGSPIPGFPGITNNRQTWIPVQFSFITAPGQTSIQLRIVDEARNIDGDDFGMTAVGLRECNPNIGVAKQAGTPTQNADGTFTIPYTVTVRNLAPPLGIPDPYVLSNLQLTENLATTFANTTIISVGNLQSSTLAVNPGFNGTTDTRLLQENVNSLAAGASSRLTFSVTIAPTSGTGEQSPYENSVLATANTVSGVQVIDRSNDGIDPDPDGDGNPNNNNNPTIAILPGQANLILVKRITNVLRGGVSLSGNNFTAFTDDPNTGNDTNPGWFQLVPQRSPIGLITLNPSTPVQTGDEVEYTIYFLSTGIVPARAVSICDPIPTGTSLVATTPQIQIGSTLSPGGTVFTPLTPLPDANPCADQRNPNGTVIFELGDVSNIPSNNVGFVRLRVRVN